MMVRRCRHCGCILTEPDDILEDFDCGPELGPIRDLQDDGVIRLSSAIVRQVIREYREQLAYLRRDPADSYAQHRLRELREELRSPYFGIISMGMDGESLIRMTEQAEREMIRTQEGQNEQADYHR